MEMSQAERKQYTSVQFDKSDIAEILELAKKLEAQLHIRLSQRMAVMYAVRELNKKKR